MPAGLTIHPAIYRLDELMVYDIFYVNLTSGNDANDGKSVANAKKTITNAISAATSGTPTKIYVWSTDGGEYDEGGTQAAEINKDNIHVIGINRPRLHANLTISGANSSSFQGLYTRIPTGNGLTFSAAAKDSMFKDIVLEPTADGQVLCNFGDSTNCRFENIVGVQTGYDIRTFDSNASKHCVAKDVHNGSVGRTNAFAVIGGGNPLGNTFINCTGVGDFQDSPLDANSGYTTLIDCAIDGKYTKNSNVVGTRFISCLLYTSPSPRDLSTSRMPSSA